MKRSGHMFSSQHQEGGIITTSRVTFREMVQAVGAGFVRAGLRPAPTAARGPMSVSGTSAYIVARCSPKAKSPFLFLSQTRYND
jgi:hypothetical protein